MSGESECSICYEAIISSVSGQAELSCGHKYHVSCIANWLTSEHAPRSCPLCRKEATSHEVPIRRSVAAVQSPTAPPPISQQPPAYHTAEIANVLSNLIRTSSNQNRRRRLQDWLLIDNYMYMNILENNQTSEGLTHIWNIVRNSMNVINNPVHVLLNISDTDYMNLLNNVRTPLTEASLWNQLRSMIVEEQNAIPVNNLNQPDQNMIINNYA
jgi:hypothetical protein